MTALFDIEPPAAVDLTGDDLREAVHRELMRHPMQTAFEVTRALHLPQTRVDSVKRQLLAMEDDGEAERHEGKRTPTDSRLAVRWVAT